MIWSFTCALRGPLNLDSQGPEARQRKVSVPICPIYFICYCTQMCGGTQIVLYIYPFPSITLTFCSFFSCNIHQILLVPVAFDCVEPSFNVSNAAGAASAVYQGNPMTRNTVLRQVLDKHAKSMHFKGILRGT